MSATLLRDNNGQPVHALQPFNPGSVVLSATSQALAIPTDSKFIRVAATGASWVAFGTSGVVATTSSILFPPGVEVFPVPDGVTHVAVIQVGASTGYFSINRMK